MTRVSISQARIHLDALLDKVRLGEVVEITKRGVPVARITPLSNLHLSDHLLDLARRGLVRLPAKSATLPELKPIIPSSGSFVGAVDALLEERRNGR